MTTVQEWLEREGALRRLRTLTASIYVRITVCEWNGFPLSVAVSNGAGWPTSAAAHARELFAIVPAGTNPGQVFDAYKNAGDGTDDYELRGLDCWKAGRRDDPMGPIGEWEPHPLAEDPGWPDEAPGEVFGEAVVRDEVGPDTVVEDGRQLGSEQEGGDDGSE